MDKKQKCAGVCREAFEPSFLRYAEKTPIYYWRNAGARFAILAN
jgi:hypothetical protein